MWRAFPARQLTGRPTRYHGYIGHERIERLCCSRDHLSSDAAERCAEKSARRSNRRIETMKVAIYAGQAGGGAILVPRYVIEQGESDDWYWCDTSDEGAYDRGFGGRPPTIRDRMIAAELRRIAKMELF